MQCDRCYREELVYQPYSGLHLCGEHLVLDIEAKAKKTIRKHHWLSSGDRIAVALSGKSASAAVLSFLVKLVGSRRDIELSAFHIELPGQDPGMANQAGNIADLLDVPFTRIQQETLPCRAVPDSPGNASGFLFPDLFTAAELHGFNKVALGTTLDDRAGYVLGQAFHGEICWIYENKCSGQGSVRIIRPFILIPECEIARYTGIRIPEILFPPHQGTSDDFANEVRRLLDAYTEKHPSAKYALAGFAEGLSPGQKAGEDSQPLIPYDEMNTHGN